MHITPQYLTFGVNFWTFEVETLWVPLLYIQGRFWRIWVFRNSGFDVLGVRAFRIQPPRYKNPIHPKNLNVHNPERLSGRYLYDKWFRFKLTLHLFWTQTHILCPSFDRVKAEKFFLLFNIWLNLCMISRSVTEWIFAYTTTLTFGVNFWTFEVETL